MGRQPGPAEIPPAQPPDLLDRAAFITSEELAGLVRVPLHTVDNWATRGGGPAFTKVGIYRRYASAAVKTWLKARENDRGHTAEPAA
jgi:phage terminase Nu1 subunit (DNA packaging protein)